MKRIGVFVCHCGHNIAGTVDVDAVVEGVKSHPEVAFAVDYKYMCSDPGQQLIRKSIEEHKLDGVVVAACSPAMHETTFRRTVSTAGMNPYRCESANIREQVSWVHQNNKEASTLKAISISRSIAEKVTGNDELEPMTLPLTRKVLIIGGGIAGMQAALDIAEAGYPVILVEREEKLGGNMARLSNTYLNFNTAPDFLRKKIDTVSRHPNIQVITQAAVKEVTGYVGNFHAQVLKSEGADNDHGSDEPTSFSLEVGAIIVATGWQPYEQERLVEYG
jgi:heterodisulfide reductase subunit A2